MAHYVIINENNLVVDVFVGRDEHETVKGVSDWEFYYSEMTNLTCLRTSYNTRGGVHHDPETGEPSADQSKALRKNYAGVGFSYDLERDAFIPPKPFESWILNEETCLWEAPIAVPEDENTYAWNEATQSWDVVSEV